MFVEIIDSEGKGERKERKIRIPLANTYWGCAKGLMFAKPEEISGILLDFRRMGRHEIWTLFVRKNIDIFYLDEDFVVVEKYENYPPVSINPRTWNVISPKMNARYVLEVWSGILNFSMGDKVTVSFSKSVSKSEENDAE